MSNITTPNKNYTTGMAEEVATHHTTGKKRTPTLSRASKEKLLHQLQDLQRDAIQGHNIKTIQGVVRYPNSQSSKSAAIGNDREATNLHGLWDTNDQGIEVAMYGDQISTASDLNSANTSLHSEAANTGSDTTTRTNTSHHNAQNHRQDIGTDSSQQLEQYTSDEDSDHVCGEDPIGCDCGLDLEDALVTILNKRPNSEIQE